jgi:rubrerythrin
MPDWTIAEVLRRALSIEAENYGEYQREADAASNPAVKAMFTFLAGEEKRHIKLIKDKMAEHNITE